MTQFTQRHFQHGVRWTFVHRDGTRTEYVYDRQLVPKTPNPDGKSPGLDAMHALLNEATGKEAQVSEKWLTEGPISGGFAHWLLSEAVEMADAA
jgi:hypothetical protein